MTFDFSEVVVVPFPFLERPISKRRPALIISIGSFNADNGHSVMAMITSAAGSSWPSDIEISDLETAGLVHRCYIRFKLFTLPNQLVLRRLGRLAAPDRRNVERLVRSSLAASA